MNDQSWPLLPLPACLLDLAADPRWVGWRWETRPGAAKPTKPPRQVNGAYAHNDKPETWSTAGEVAQVARARRFDGIGLQLLGLTSFAALDLDNVRDPETGKILPWAEEAICWGSYAEMTPSGTGFRVLGRVEPDETPRHRKFAHPGGGEVEFYVNIPTGRFITVTSSRVDGAPDALAPIGPLIAKLWGEVNADEPRGGLDFERSPGAGECSPDFASLPEWLRTTIEHGRSGDRSADFQAAANGLRARVDFDVALRLFREHPSGPAGKYGDRLEDELRRSWEKAAASSRTRRPEEMPAGAEPDDADGFDFSHDALALDLGARSWDQNARYVALWGQWLFWTGTHWERDTTRQDFRRTRAYLGTCAREVLAWATRKAEEHEVAGEEKAAEKVRSWAKSEARTLRNKVTVAAVESLAQSNRASAARAEDFDAAPMLLGTPGGTVDLRTGDTRAAQRADYITRLTTVAPEHGPASRWLGFLEEVFQGDQELIAFMQRAAGYSLTGETREHKLLFCYGGGRNGKGTFLETLFYILGDYGRRIAASALLNSQGEKHPTDLAGLRGARFVVGSELPRGKSWDEAALKDLTGGDVLTARFMRQDFFDFRPQFTLWIAGNTMPSFKGVDEALRARVVLVPFTVTIPAERRDTELPMKLREEAGQILSWAIEGAVEWQRRGLAVPVSVARASQDYMDGEDTLGQFLADETVQEPMGFVTTTALYQRFTQWAEGQGLHGWTLRTMQKELATRGLPVARRSAGAGFLGVRLR